MNTNAPPHDDRISAPHALHVPRGNIYDLAGKRRNRPPRSAAEALERLQREERQLARQAAALGLPYTHPRPI